MIQSYEIEMKMIATPYPDNTNAKKESAPWLSCSATWSFRIILFSSDLLPCRTCSHQKKYELSLAGIVALRKERNFNS